MKDICGVILSGGVSRRYGTPKAFETLEGIPFWKYSWKAIQRITGKQIIVSHTTLYERFKEIENGQFHLILDEAWVRGKGPMAGIYSAMKNQPSDWYVVLSCDIPKIKEETISRLLSFRTEDVQAVIPVINEKVQPLVGLYHYSVVQKLEQHLRQEHLKMMSLLNEINVRYVKEDELKQDISVFQNINLPSDYENLSKEEKK